MWTILNLNWNSKAGEREIESAKVRGRVRRERMIEREILTHCSCNCSCFKTFKLSTFGACSERNFRRFQILINIEQTMFICLCFCFYGCLSLVCTASLPHNLQRTFFLFGHPNTRSFNSEWSPCNLAQCTLMDLLIFNSEVGRGLRQMAVSEFWPLQCNWPIGQLLGQRLLALC